MARHSSTAGFSATPCVTCGSAKILSAMRIEQEGVWPSDPGHQLVYSHIVLYQCLDCTAAQIERYLHDCYPHDEPWDSWEWYSLGPVDALNLGRVIQGRCPDPLSPDCDCTLHQALRTECHRLPISPWPDPTTGFKLPVVAPAQVHATAVDLSGDTPRLLARCREHHPRDIGHDR